MTRLWEDTKHSPDLYQTREEANRRRAILCAEDLVLCVEFGAVARESLKLDAIPARLLASMREMRLDMTVDMFGGEEAKEDVKDCETE